MSRHFQIAIIGSGPGGYVAALKAGQMGANTAIVEKAHLGGTCLNDGCIPSKALLASAELMHHIRHASEMGISVPSGTSVDWTGVQARKDRILNTLRGGIKSLLGGRKVAIYQGIGKLAGPGKVVVLRQDGQTEQLTADDIIIATGSTPARIPGWPTDPQLICTSDEALHWKTLPARLLIVGGGVIGCEFACMMAALGVEVTVVELLPHILPNIDAQIAGALATIFTKRGIRLHTGAKIEDLAVADGIARARLADGTTVEADRVLVATGRRPNTAEIGLETASIATDRGFIRVNDRMQTPLKGHWCVGDANGRCLLAHAASAQGIVAVENALGHERDLTAPIPNCVYTFPEIATVGMTAEEARAAGLPITVGQFPLAFLGKAMAVNDADGFVKVVRHRETGQLLGVHMIGHNATECIAAAAALLYQKAKVDAVAEMVFAHPTMSEALKESAEDALSMALHLPPRKVLRAMATT